MQAFLCNLMAAALIVHSAIGCCCRGSLCDDCCQDDVDLTQAASGWEAHDFHDDSAPSPAKCKLGCCGLCSYLPTAKSHVPAPQVSCAIDFVPAQSQALEYRHASVASVAGGDAHMLGPPLRLHLMNQILLI